MGEYVLAFDDAGGIEPLIRWDGSLVTGDHPVTTLTWVMLARRDLDAFNERWTHLRRKIQRELACPELPAIHLRLMYGRTLPRKYRARPNPYLGASFDQVLGWIEDAYRLIWTFGRRSRKLEFGTVQGVRAEMARPLQAYVADPRLRAELLFMEQECRKIGQRRLAERYLKRVASPLLSLFREGMIYISEILRAYGARDADLFLDSFSDSHGIDADEVVKSIQEIEGLAPIASVQRVDADDVPLVQAADLLGWIAFRKELFRFRGQDPDPLLARIENKYAFGGLTPADFGKIRRRVALNYDKMAPAAQGVFYLVARRIIETDHPAFAERHMVTVEELMARIEAINRGHVSVSGISIIKDPTVCEHLIP